MWKDRVEDRPGLVSQSNYSWTTKDESQKEDVSTGFEPHIRYSGEAETFSKAAEKQQKKK